MNYTTGPSIPHMTAGACFAGPDDGALRLAEGEVLHALDDHPPRRGLLVQQFSEERWRWETVCPLTDAHFMVDGCPLRWRAASIHLRDLIENDLPVTLDIERAAIAEARG